jgi:translation initiation factor 4G
MVVLKPSHFGPKPGSLSDPASNARQQQQQSQPPVLQTPEAAAVPEEKKVNHKEVLLKKTESIMEELMKPSPNDDEQVVEEVAQVKSPSIDDISLQLKSLKIPKNHASDVVEVVIKSTLSKTDRDRENASQLLINLKKEGVVSNTVFISAIRGLLNKLKQLEVDDPLVKTHLSEFIARAVASDILTVVESLEVVNSHYPMFLLILQQLREIKGREWLSSSIESHKINLMTVLPEADRNKEQLCDILENRGLSFLLPLLRVESDLKKLLLQDSPPASILKWIKDTVEASLTSSKPFIVILFTAVVDFIVTKSSVNQDEKKQADSEKEMIKSFSKLLKAFVFDKPSLQLTGLYALQTLCHQLKFPKGMLLRWFNALYDLEVIEDEVFLRWKEDINDDFPGKGQALFQVNTWLIWLAEVEEEEEEEEDDEPEEEVREEDNNGIHRNDN